MPLWFHRLEQRRMVLPWLRAGWFQAASAWMYRPCSTDRHAGARWDRSAVGGIHPQELAAGTPLRARVGGGGGPLAEALPNEPFVLPGSRIACCDPIDLSRLSMAARRVKVQVGADLVHAHLSASEMLAATAFPRGVPIVASRRGRTPNHDGETLVPNRPTVRPSSCGAHDLQLGGISEPYDGDGSNPAAACRGASYAVLS